MKGQQIDIKKLISDNKTALTDRDGLKPLFIIAERISRKDNLQLENNVENQILNLDLENLNIEQVNTLLSFVYYSKIDVSNIIPYFKKYITSNAHSSSDLIVLKRGILIRFIIELKVKYFNLKDILAEKNLREKSPWIWIDCMSYYNWSIAEDEISIQISKKQHEFQNLLYRIPAFHRRIDNHLFCESLQTWHANLSKLNKQKLDDWANKFKVKVSDLSLEAISKIDSLPLFQNELMEY